MPRVDFRFIRPEEGAFLERLNRFLAKVKVGGREVECFLANPARGERLFRRGADVVVQKSHAGDRKTRYDLLLVRQGRTWVLVDTRIANQIVFRALKGKRLPELADYDSVQKEARWRRSRFDFLLCGKGKRAYLEVKSVSLAEGGVARFPDGVTERGRKHIEELSAIARQGLGAFVLFLVERDDASELSANFSVDPAFSASLLMGIAGGVVPLAYHVICGVEGVRLGRKMPILGSDLGTPPNKGCYHLIIELRKRANVCHRKFSETPFPPGFYIYTGRARKNLLQRVARHLTKKHRKMWHIDYLLASPYARIVDGIVMVQREGGECIANREVGTMAGAAVVARGFGSSDCRCGCPAHLYWFKSLPERFARRLPPHHR